MKFTIGAVGDVSVRAKNNIAIVYVNSFKGDDYHNFITSTDELSDLDSKIDKIKHINKDPETYHNSLSVYNEYMELLAEKYGGDKLFRVAFKHGMVTEKIPPRPEFKVNKKNRDVWNIIKDGGSISKVNNLSMSEEQEQDYLQRAGLTDCMEEVTVEAGEHSKELQKFIKKEKPKMGIEYDDDTENEYGVKQVPYVDSRSLNNFLNMNYGDVGEDGQVDFEVTLTDIWEDSERYRKKLEKEATEEIRHVHVNTRWRKCSAGEMDNITSFESCGWDIDKLKEKFSGDTISDRIKDKKKSKKDKKNKKKREAKFTDFEIKSCDEDDYGNEQDDRDLFKDFVDFTADYFDFSAQNIVIR